MANPILDYPRCGSEWRVDADQAPPARRERGRNCSLIRRRSGLSPRNPTERARPWRDDAHGDRLPDANVIPTSSTDRRFR